MKRKQLYALGLAVSIASSAMAGSTMSVAAMDDSMDTAIVQETAETPDASVTGGGEVETEENLPAEGDASIEENVSAGESASIEENISTEGNTTIEGSITADNAVAAENAPVKEETNKASTGMKPSTTYAVVDKSELEEEIQRAELVEENQSWYTPDSYAPVESALQVARAVMNNDSATEAEVTAAIQNLRTAQSGLVLTAQGLLDYVESQISGPMSYTPESWDAYQAEKAKVEAVIADPGAYTEPQWQQIAADYQEAYRKLAMLPSLTDKAGLETLIGRAQSVVNNASWYDPASVTAVQNLLNSIGVQPGDNEVAVSEAVKDLDSYETEQMMNQIMNTLNTVLVSQEGLIQLADELAAQIQQLENTGYYDTTELQSLATKVANAKNVFEAATSTTDQINGAVQDLSDVQDALDTIKMSAADVKNKLAALVGESAYAGLRTAIEAGDNTYTENSKAFFKDSYDTAKALVDSTDMAEPEEYQIGRAHV